MTTPGDDGGARVAVLHGYVSVTATIVVDADLAYMDTPRGVNMSAGRATSAFTSDRDSPVLRTWITPESTVAPLMRVWQST
jgi:hypothetical protein